jgi:predicted nucleotidyltransferase
MTDRPTATSLDPRIRRIAAVIRAEIPGCEVRLFGSHARGTARPDSDADLLITVPDAWLAGHDRLKVLGGLWRKLASHRLPLDLLLYSQAEVRERAHYRSAVTTQAYQEGILLNG